MITAKIIKDSYYETNRVTTLECEYPRFILSELNTHRQLSKNSSSSRAIPIKRMCELILEQGAEPTYWGKNQPGMQSYEELDEETKLLARQLWLKSRAQQVLITEQLSDLGVHKQIANRLTEPFHLMKTVVTATSWQNFFDLRLDHATQPEFRLLALKIKEAIDQSEPEYLNPYEWHLPYIDTQRIRGRQEFSASGLKLTLDQALKMSVSLCAQVSYRRLDHDLAKCERIYEQLVVSEPKHMSPAEHQAMRPVIDKLWPEGVTMKDKDNNFYSGNFMNWIQLRKLIE